MADLKRPDARGMLIASISPKQIGQAREFARYFEAVELDLKGVKQVIDASEKTRLCIAALRLREAGLKVHSIHLRGFDLSERTRKVVKRAVRFCNGLYPILKPEVAVIHPGRGDRETLYANLAHLAGSIPPELTIAVENMTSPKSLLSSIDDLRILLDKMAAIPNAGICIDSSHPGVAAQITPDGYTELVLAYMKEAGERLCHVHLSDRRKESDGTTKHLPIGTGMVNWGAVRGFLESGYGGKAAIEIRTDDRLEDTISSACRFYSCERRDLKREAERKSMPDAVRIDKEAFLEKINMPPSLVSRLSLPPEGILEEGEGFTYFVAPSESYTNAHADPYDLITGVEDKVEWADYVFGIVLEGKRTHAVLIDKKRKIAVEEAIADPHEKAGTDWSRFEEAIINALREVAKFSDADHIVGTNGGSHIVMGDEPNAWE
jgi:sugar phosphate isomerase/epimerase